MQKFTRVLTSMLLCILIAPVLLFAQETTADIADIVSSQEGAVLTSTILLACHPRWAGKPLHSPLAWMPLSRSR